MGFLRFLSKKKDSADDLDVPPVPPSMDFGEFDKQFPSPMPGDDIPSMNPYSSQGNALPDGFPSFDDAHFNDDPNGSPAPPTQEPGRIPSFLSKSQPSAPAMDRPVEHPHHRHHPKGPTYVEVHRFHQMISDLATIRSDLRKAGLGLTEMMNTITDREKDYAKYRGSLIDIQKKLVFVDKTLFSKGETQ